MTGTELATLRTELQGDNPLLTCNREAGSFSRLWGRECWVADSVLSCIQDSIDEQMDTGNLNDPLFKVWDYCRRLRELNRIGEFPEVID